jgi:hypothetical protein
LFSQDQLLLCCAASSGLSRAVAECLLPQLLRVAKREETLRVQLWGAGGILLDVEASSHHSLLWLLCKLGNQLSCARGHNCNSV